MAVQIQGGSNSAGKANVNSDYELLVAPTRNVAKAGFVGMAGDSGDTGAHLMRPAEVNSDHRMRVSADKLLYHRLFNAIGQAPEVYLNSSTFTWAYGGLTGGGVRFNANATVNTAFGFMTTWQTFPVPLEGGYYCSMFVNIPAHQNNTLFSMGFMSGSLAISNTEVQDGVFLRRTALGALQFVVRRNNTDMYTEAVVDTGITYGEYHRVLISVTATDATLWIDGVFKAHIDFESDATGKVYLWSVPALRVFALQLNANTVPAASSMYVMEWAVWDQSDSIVRTSAEVAAGRLLTTPNLSNTQGSSTSWTNSGAVTSLTLSNTTSTLGNTLLGGLCSFAAVAGGNTDYIILAALVHAGNTVSGHTFYVTGVRVSAVNTGAANSGTVPTTLLFGLGVGSTAVSLATTDNTTTRLPRRMPLGTIEIPVNAVIGQSGNQSIEQDFASPVAVHVDGHVHLIMRVQSGAATASQVIVLNVQILGYYA